MIYFIFFPQMEMTQKGNLNHINSKKNKAYKWNQTMQIYVFFTACTEG